MEGSILEDFYIERRLRVFTDSDPITFAYKTSYDFPSSHNLHIHHNYELYFYIEGDADYIVNNAYYKLHRGDVMIISPNETHMLVLKRPCQYTRFYMVFPPTVFTNHIINPLQTLLRRTTGGSAKLTLPTLMWERVYGMMQDIIRVCREDPSDTGELLHTKIYAMLLQLLCSLSEKSTSVQSIGDQFGAAHLPGPMREAMSYIESHLTQNITVREIAEAIHISPPYLSSVFRKHMGVPLVTYLQTRKIVLAKQLREEGRSVTYACYESGFSDCSYFIRIFKEKNGITPGKFRQLHSDLYR